MYCWVFPLAHWSSTVRSEVTQTTHCGPGGRPMYRKLLLIASMGTLLGACVPYATDGYVRTDVYSVQAPAYEYRPDPYPYGYSSGYYVRPAPRYYVPPPVYYRPAPPPMWRHGPSGPPGGWRGGPPPQWRGGGRDWHGHGDYRRPDGPGRGHGWGHEGGGGRGGRGNH